MNVFFSHWIDSGSKKLFSSQQISFFNNSIPSITESLQTFDSIKNRHKNKNLINGGIGANINSLEEENKNLGAIDITSLEHFKVKQYQEDLSSLLNNNDAPLQYPGLAFYNLNKETNQIVFNENDLLLLQLPKLLPEVDLEKTFFSKSHSTPLNPNELSREKSSTNESELPSSNPFQEKPFGKIGKLKIFRSGKALLCMGNLTYQVIKQKLI